ncbi:MAG: hypothetical protein K9K86_10160 [Pseudomonadales bacterium]|nr:hypothetical protein [Pseudomonadales bacterium]
MALPVNIDSLATAITRIIEGLTTISVAINIIVQIITDTLGLSIATMIVVTDTKRTGGTVGIISVIISDLVILVIMINRDIP